MLNNSIMENFGDRLKILNFNKLFAIFYKEELTKKIVNLIKLVKKYVFIVVYLKK